MYMQRIERVELPDVAEEARRVAVGFANGLWLGMVTWVLAGLATALLL